MDNINYIIAKNLLLAIFVERGISRRPSDSEIDQIAISIDLMIEDGWEPSISDMHAIAFNDFEVMAEYSANRGFIMFNQLIDVIVNKK